MPAGLKTAAGRASATPVAGEAVPVTTEVDVLGVGLDADHDAGARGELVVVADLATADEAVVAAAVAEGEDAGAVPGRTSECWRRGERR